MPYRLALFRRSCLFAPSSVSSGVSFVEFLVQETVRAHGIGPLSNFVCATCLQFCRSDTALARLYFWLSKERSGSKSSRSEGAFDSLVQPPKKLLPTHLPACPLEVAPPKGRRARATWFAARAAWVFTEWSLSLLGFYELGGPSRLSACRL